MLFLYFRIGDEGFAMTIDRIVEVMPLTELKKVRQAPEGVAGSFDYRGRFIQVIDLCTLELGRPAHRRLSTRIIVIRHPQDDTVLLGLIAENATEMLRLDPAEFAPFAPGPHGLVQRVELEGLIPAPLLAAVCSQPVTGQ
ncbi:chemotaxis protein CheW [Labrys sp. KNU-23]|uniref:chemotaxis protein CheW n=1 Tax=Labrys sp. KNU-23 TaxID=2789216 RepID=UPI0011EDD62E|nr:chemotaxis protein CheW [Labrys sp. KNU-23]QEN85475.1 chemotaxis protein CheW [Labrys sp. KNU-23]